MNWRTKCHGQRFKSREQRFWEKVDKSGDCWLWTACKDKDGYGFFRDKGKNLKAHRVSLEMHCGHAVSGLILHSCDTPSCVNPSHLREGNSSANQRDAVIRGNHHSVKICADDVVRIREAVKFGAKAKQLASAYGIGLGSVYSIINGKKWAHVHQ